MGIQEFIGSKRLQVLTRAEKHGACNVRVSGSVADGKNDIDSLIDLESGGTLLDLGSLFMDLQDLLHRKIDVLTRVGLLDRIKDNVLRLAVPL